MDCYLLLLYTVFEKERDKVEETMRDHQKSREGDMGGQGE